MLTLVMAVMVVTAVVLLPIMEVVHPTSDPLFGVLEERSVMPMLMLSGMEVDTVSHTMPYLETLSSQDLPQSDIIQEVFSAVKKFVSSNSLFVVTNSKMLKTQLCQSETLCTKIYNSSFVSLKLLLFSTMRKIVIVLFQNYSKLK